MPVVGSRATVGVAARTVVPARPQATPIDRHAAATRRAYLGQWLRIVLVLPSSRLMVVEPRPGAAPRPRPTGPPGPLPAGPSWRGPRSASPAGSRGGPARRPGRPRGDPRRRA